ncbi:pirin family protein [Arhodomonas sp. AD133]|uniref:pirin family protein n=1 Tax=Arhodomonas sp. AD133 TaxID=3415009 RepID=UPI003EBEDAC4
MSHNTSSASRRITRVVRGMPASDGAGVRLTRIIGTPELDAVDPFLMLDEFRSDQADDYLAGFPEHPHRGFETVTYMLAGRMRHRDNQGNSGLLGPGSVQWMTAGRGIVHSEMPEQADGLMWGFQLWVNLPAAEKMTTPRYLDIAAERIAAVTPAPGVTVRVIAGRVDDAEGPVRGVVTDPVYFDVAFEPGAQWCASVPDGHAGFVYVFDGAMEVAADDGARSVSRGELGVLSDGADVALASRGGGRCLLVAGRPLGEPVARHGPFVMNTRDELIQAVEDYQAGRF